MIKIKVSRNVKKIENMKNNLKQQIAFSKPLFQINT